MGPIYRNLYRAVVIAAISFFLTFIITTINLLETWSKISQEELPASLIRNYRTRAIQEWLYLPAAAFFSTSICAVAFEYASSNRNRLLTVTLLIISPILLFFTGAVAYIPYEEELKRGWLVNLGITPKIPFLAGTTALILGLIWRRYLNNRSRSDLT